MDPSLLQITIPTNALIRNAADDNSQFKVPHGGLVGIKDLDAYFALAAKQSMLEVQQALRGAEKPLADHANSVVEITKLRGRVLIGAAPTRPKPAAAKVNDQSGYASATKPATDNASAGPVIHTGNVADKLAGKPIAAAAAGNGESGSVRSRVVDAASGAAIGGAVTDANRDYKLSGTLARPTESRSPARRLKHGKKATIRTQRTTS